MRILIIEDEPRIASFIRRGLEEESYAVDVASDGEEGFSWLSNFSYDLIISDVLMPKLNGLELCKKIREAGIKTPILLLTAKDTVDDKVLGLDAGADDYLVKPFSFKELLARVRALMRRHEGADKNSKLTSYDLTLDLLTRRVERGGSEIELTNKEFALLEFLMQNQGQVLSRTLIAEHVWDYDFYNQSNIIDVYVRQLRKKIDDPFELKLINSVRGAGYKLKGGKTE